MKTYRRLLMTKVQAFTLVEMLIVLLIVSVLLLLFVPNISQQKDKIENSGGRALVKVVESQAELYELSGMNTASLSVLVAENLISQEQADKYLEYYERNPGQVQQVPY